MAYGLARFVPGKLQPRFSIIDLYPLAMRIGRKWSSPTIAEMSSRLLRNFLSTCASTS